MVPILVFCPQRLRYREEQAVPVARVWRVLNRSAANPMFDGVQGSGEALLKPEPWPRAGQG